MSEEEVSRLQVDSNEKLSVQIDRGESSIQRSSLGIFSHDTNEETTEDTPTINTVPSCLDRNGNQPTRIKTAWEYAKECADHELIVFSLKKGTKEDDDWKNPKIGGWQNLTLEESKQHLKNPRFKTRNWGLVTGAKSGNCIIDLDKEKGEKRCGVQWMENWYSKNPDAIIPKFIVQTGSGGFHYYFRYDDEVGFKANFIEITENGAVYGVDCRSTGGYIVLPGSVNLKTGQRCELLLNEETGVQLKFRGLGSDALFA
jgi:hypothetical protein